MSGTPDPAALARAKRSSRRLLAGFLAALAVAIPVGLVASREAGGMSAEATTFTLNTWEAEDGTAEVCDLIAIGGMQHTAAGQAQFLEDGAGMDYETAKAWLEGHC